MVITGIRCKFYSIICEEDVYFRELIRYIHLNPLRANLVNSLAELDQYKWSGHSVLVGNRKNNWQDRNYVLEWFGKRKREAIKAYRDYVKKGIDKGQRPELVGGGLIRSKGGWSQVKSLSGLAQPQKEFQAQGCFEKPGGKFVLQAVRI